MEKVKLFFQILPDFQVDEGWQSNVSLAFITLPSTAIFQLLAFSVSSNILLI